MFLNPKFKPVAAYICKTTLVVSDWLVPRGWVAWRRVALTGTPPFVQSPSVLPKGCVGALGRVSSDNATKRHNRGGGGGGGFPEFTRSFYSLRESAKQL